MINLHRIVIIIIIIIMINKKKKEEDGDDLLVGRRLSHSRLSWEIGLFHIFDPTNTLGIHIFHSPAKPFRNFLIQIKTKIDLMLWLNVWTEIFKPNNRPTNKILHSPLNLWFRTYHYHTQFEDNNNDFFGGMMMNSVEEDESTSNSLWSSFPVGDVTTYYAWDTTWSYCLHCNRTESRTIWCTGVLLSCWFHWSLVYCDVVLCKTLPLSVAESRWPPQVGPCKNLIHLPHLSQWIVTGTLFTRLENVTIELSQKLFSFSPIHQCTTEA